MIKRTLKLKYWSTIASWLVLQFFYLLMFPFSIWRNASGAVLAVWGISISVWVLALGASVFLEDNDFKSAFTVSIFFSAFINAMTSWFLIVYSVGKCLLHQGDIYSILLSISLEAICITILGCLYKFFPDL